MRSISIGFPIDGESVCEALHAMSEAADDWIVESIETLTGQDASLLGDLWRNSSNGAFMIRAGDLCLALNAATQVVTLDAHLAKNIGVRICIEDGVAIDVSAPDG